MSPAPRGSWRELVECSDACLPSQTPEWTDAICATGPFADASLLFELADGRPAVLPMVRRTRVPRRIAGQFSMAPTWGAGGLLAAGPLDASDLVPVLDHLMSRRVLRTVVRPAHDQWHLWDAALRELRSSAAGAGTTANVLSRPVVHHVLDLDRPFGELHAGFSKMARKAIRKGEREGVKVEDRTGPVVVEDYYRLYERWIEQRARARGMPLAVARARGRANEPRDRLDLLAEVLGDRFRVWVANLDGEPVAAMITLIQGRTALAWRAAADKERAGPVRAMDVLHRYAIEHAVEQGCHSYNMGESGGVESLMRFKTRFGATPRAHGDLRIERLPVTRMNEQLDGIVHRVESAVVARAAARSSRQP